VRRRSALLRAAALALPALLAACAGPAEPPPRPAVPPDNPAVAECRVEARSAVAASRNFARERNLENQNQLDRVQREQEEAESRAFADCLRRRGLARGGGVEQPRSPGLFSF
jgi:hypothetical protein